MPSVLSLLPLVAVASALVVPTPKIDARGLGTSAEVYVYNDWTKPITVVSSENHHMSTLPPASLQVAAGAVSQKFFVDANGLDPKQSSFSLTFQPADSKDSVVKFEIGTTPNKTRFTLGEKNPGGQVGVLLAPAKILEKGRDFDFHIFTGAGAFTPFVQGIVDQQIGTILGDLKKNPVEVPVTPDLKVTVREIINPTVKVTYVNLGNGPTGAIINAIINFSGEVRMTAAWKGIKQEAVVKVGNVAALATAEGSVTNLASLKVTRFQTSIETIELGGDILVDIIGALYPVFSGVLKLPYKIASIVNTSENANIIAMINVAIKAFAPKA